MNPNTQSENLFLHLLQASLWKKRPEASCFYNVSAEVWEKIFRISVLHGVQAIVCDAIIQLPSELYPPSEIKILWAIRVKQIEAHNEYKRKILAELCELYEQKNIRIMLLKGIALDECYPTPIHRESGDIDLWLLGKSSEGDNLMKNLGKKIYNFGEKHSCAYYKGIPIENHRTFLNVDRFVIDKHIEACLKEVLQEDGYEVFILENETILIPPSTFNIIFNGRHILTHLPREIVIRHLCDWAMLLYANQGKYDVDKVIQIFRQVGIYPVVCLFTQLAIEYIGLPLSAVPFEIVITNKELQSRLFIDILHAPTRRKPPYTNIICSSLWRCKRFYKEHWKYRLIYNENLFQRILRSILWFYRNHKNPIY